MSLKVLFIGNVLFSKVSNFHQGKWKGIFSNVEILLKDDIRSKVSTTYSSTVFSSVKLFHKHRILAVIVQVITEFTKSIIYQMTIPGVYPQPNRYVFRYLLIIA